MYDVIVLGLGTFGAAAAAELTARGKKVLGLEQFSIPHAMGSHHGHSRVFRTAYFEHPDYVPLLRQAHKRWIEMDRKRGGGLFFQTGALYAGPRGCSTVDGALESARRHRLDAHRLTPSDLAARFPQFHLPQGFEAMWESCAGYIAPEHAVSWMVREALNGGADLRGHEKVFDWAADGSGVVVHTQRGVFHARSLVITAGAWSSQVLKNLHVPLTVTRQVLAWYWPRRPAIFSAPAFPVWAIENEEGLFHYGFPMTPSPLGVKIALHKPGVAIDPDSVDRFTRSGDEAQTRAALGRYLPDADGQLLALSVCLYTNSPDGHFIIDRHPAHPNVSFICGCSGHGFKFAPVVGEILADLSTTGQTAHSIGFLGLSRLAGRKGSGT
ncbi:MAG: N-methyl-L-tryptophan oxidase [Phycisphaerales bacterium]|nr:N-methyl-L-tryptophan oxidase [Phycisphaerales bacterium]